MPPKKEKSIRVSVTLKGDLAQAFISEFARAVKESDGSAGKSEVARTLFVEALKARGYSDIEDTVSWGGYRERDDDDDEQEQVVAVALAG